jgi:carbon-monoxide dehydrogenase medium subunit
MNSFDYRRATSAAQATAWLREDPDAKLLAGGQSLLAAIKLRLAAPSLLIDLQGMPELQAIREDGQGVWIGAMCTHASAAASPLVRKRLPMIARLAQGIADQQVRNRGTMGGSLANADPAACWAAGVLAMGGVICTDRREIAADDYFCGLFTTALEPDELLMGVRFAPADQAHYLKFEQPASRFAMVGVAVARQGPSVRVGLTGLGHGTSRWPEAEQALAREFAPKSLSAIQLDVELATGDLHASAQYRAHLAGVLARRAVAQAMTLNGT